MKNTIFIFILLIILIFIQFNNKQEYFLDNISNNRKIKIQASEKELLLIKNIINNYKNEFIKRNVEIEYIIKPNFKAELYGYDSNLKKTVYKKEEIIDFLKEIDNMPMGILEKKERDIIVNRKDLLEKCGLPDIPETSHCFNDTTHHTCCLLGSEARDYADNSGNPIGTTSVNVLGRKPKDNELVPWCTCTGSKVCSFYKNKFNDGTNIKFIGNTNTENEDEAINELKITRHNTPGIY